jgi:hypothetical protein
MTRDISLLFFLYRENEQLHQHVLKHVLLLENPQEEDARAG